jgi:glycosyltransferase involved in cell wall biosynthesis
MRILYLACGHVQGSDSLSGQVAHALARMAQREGHHVKIVTFPTEGFDQAGCSRFATRDFEELVKGVQTRRLTAPNAAEAAIRFSNWLGEQRFDVLHGVVSHPNDLPFALSVDTLPPLVITLTGLPVKSVQDTSPVASSWMRYADQFVVPTADAMGQWHDVWPESRFRVMPHGVDLLALIQSRQMQMRDITAESPLTLLCVGTFDPSSGILEVIKAFGSMDCRDARLRLVGSADENSKYGQLLNHAIRADSRVVLTSTQAPQSLAAISHPFDAVWLPRLGSLAFSLMELECAALGVRCFTDRSGAHLVSDGVSGTVQSPASSDASAWAAVLEQWVRSFDRSRQPNMRAAVPVRIEEEAFLYEGLYRTLIFNRARGV